MGKHNSSRFCKVDCFIVIFFFSDPSSSPVVSPFLLHSNINNNNSGHMVPSLDSNGVMAPSNNLYERAAKLLFMCVGWARSVPSFLSLAPADQTALLEEAWAPLFVVAMAQFWTDFDEGTAKLGNLERV